MRIRGDAGDAPHLPPNCFPFNQFLGETSHRRRQKSIRFYYLHVTETQKNLSIEDACMHLAKTVIAQSSPTQKRQFFHAAWVTS